MAITLTKETPLQVVATYKKGTKSFSVMRIVKKGTSRIFFFPLTDKAERLNKTFYARKYDAVKIGKIYLNN